MGLKEQSLTIAAVIEKIETVCEFVSDVARSAGMDEDAVYHCYLAVEEICTNIIEHGYHYKGSDKVIEVVCQPQGDKLLIIVRDDAEPFNPLHLDDPDPKAPLLERHGGGWGVFFVKKYMDRVDYRYDKKRNNFIMEKHF